MVHLKMIAIIHVLDSKIKWLAHWPSTANILGLNPFDSNPISHRIQRINRQFS